MSPANANMAAIEMCWISLVVYGAPGAAPKRSIHTFVAPYVNTTMDSTSSALTPPPPAGRWFHAQPRSANAPTKRPNVASP
jgi:hypothetical protein